MADDFITIQTSLPDEGQRLTLKFPTLNNKTFLGTVSEILKDQIKVAGMESTISIPTKFYDKVLWKRRS
jgi:hypothetical protein